MIAIGYIRISTKDQSAYSLDYQERSIVEYCAKNNIKLLEVFRDDGESSYTFDRPDWKALEAFIKKNKQITHLITLDHDRFSRNLAEALLKIKELQDKYKIKVLATTDSVDTDFTDPTTFMMRAFKFMIAESELHGIRKRTKNGIQQANMNGRFVNKAPYGYINARDADNKPILLIDDFKAAIVRKIFKLYNNGATVEEIVKEAKAMGYKQSGNSAIQNKLKNPVYCGLVKVSGKAGKLVKGLHAPIISEQEYWMASERINGKRNIAHKSEEVPLRGVLRCFCGKLVTAGKSKGKSKHYWYYWCTEHKNNLPARKIHEQFNELLSTLSVDPGLMDLMKEKLIRRIAERIHANGEDLASAQKELKNIKGRIATTERKFLLQPDISEEVYKSVIGELRAQESSLQAKIAEVGSTADFYLNRLNDVLPKLVDLKQAFDSMDLIQQHRFVNLVFKQSLSYSNGSFRTPQLLDFFEDKELILKEKGLLKIEQPIVKLGLTPIRSEIGSWFEQLTQLADLLAS